MTLVRDGSVKDMEEPDLESKGYSLSGPYEKD